jgi:DNA polymerase-3 subunit beta
MQVIVNCALLRDGLSKVLSVVDKRNARPILTHCKIEALENRLEISATDLEVSAKI